MCKEKYCYLSLDFQTIPYLFLKHHIPDIQIKRAQWVLGFMSPSWILPSSRRQTTSLRLHRHKIKHMKSETNFLRVDRWDDWIKKTHSCEKCMHKYHASPSNHYGRHHTPGLLLILHSSNYTPKYEFTVASLFSCILSSYGQILQYNLQNRPKSINQNKSFWSIWDELLLIRKNRAFKDKETYLESNLRDKNNKSMPKKSSSHFNLVTLCLNTLWSWFPFYLSYVNFNS